MNVDNVGNTARELGSSLRRLNSEAENDGLAGHDLEIEKIVSIEDFNLRYEKLILLAAHYKYNKDVANQILSKVDFYNLSSSNLGILIRDVLENTDFEFDAISDLEPQIISELYRNKINQTYNSNSSDFKYLFRDLYVRGLGEKTVKFLREESFNPDFDDENYLLTLLYVAEKSPNDAYTILQNIINNTENIPNEVDKIVENLVRSQKLSLDQFNFLESLISFEPKKFYWTITYLLETSEENYNKYKKYFFGEDASFNPQSYQYIHYLINENFEEFPVDIFNNIQDIFLEDVFSKIIIHKPEWEDDCWNILMERLSNNDLSDFSEVLHVFSIEKYGEQILTLIEDNISLLETHTYELYNVLKKLSEHGFKDRINNIVKKIATPLEYNFGENLDLFKQTLKDHFLHSIRSLNIPDLQVTIQLDNFNSLVENLNEEELFFVNLIVQKHGFLSRQVIDILEGSRSYAQINKTDSKLFIFTSGVKKGLIINEIPSESKTIWKELHKIGVPVAPVLRDSNRNKDNNIRVFSRYCGKSLYYIFSEISANIENGFANIFTSGEFTMDDLNRLYYAPQDDFVAEIYKQRDEIIKNLEEMNISHNHPHQGNFTVEFVKKKYLEEYLSKPEINWFGEIQTPNRNNIPFDPNNFSFDIRDFYVSDPDTGEKEWEMIVRLIGWDRASTNNSEEN